MIIEHHDFTGTVWLPERDTPYPLGEYVTLKLTFGLDDGEQLIVQARIIGGSVPDPSDPHPKFVGHAHIEADPGVEVLP